MEILHVYANDVIDWIVASSPEEARTLAIEELGSGHYDIESEEYELCSDDEPLTIRDEDKNERVTKTCAEWCADNGKGFLCSTEH